MKQNIEMPNEAHLACILLLDTSGSMAGERIRSLNEGVRRFIEQVSKDDMAKRRLDVAILEFNDKPNLVQDFLPISQMSPITLKAEGYTAMGQAIETAVRMVKERNLLYCSKGTPMHKPWIFMITDGRPEGESPDCIERAIELVQREEHKGGHGKLKFWSLAVSGADKNLLHRLSDRVLELDGNDFTGIFNWMAESMSFISVSVVGSDPTYAPLPQNVVPAQW